MMCHTKDDELLTQLDQLKWLQNKAINGSPILGNAQVTRLFFRKITRYLLKRYLLVIQFTSQTVNLFGTQCSAIFSHVPELQSNYWENCVCSTACQGMTIISAFQESF